MCKVTVVAVGSEIAKGFVLNTNSHFIAKQLNDAGFEVIEHVTVLDDADMILDRKNSLIGYDLSEQIDRLKPITVQMRTF